MYDLLKGHRVDMWRCCTTEGCAEPTKHQALCWRCMMQLLSYLQLRGVDVHPSYKDRRAMLCAVEKTAGRVDPRPTDQL